MLEELCSDKFSGHVSVYVLHMPLLQHLLPASSVLVLPYTKRKVIKNPLEESKLTYQ